MATTRNKVMWQEGMLMRPHHFQQQQRYNDYLDNQRFRAMNDLSWGFTELTLNNELLAQGKIMIDSASGTLPAILLALSEIVKQFVSSLSRGSISAILKPFLK